jgi:hypothetical protein
MVLVAALVAASTPDDQTASAGALKQDAGNDSGLNRGVNLDSWFQPIKNGDTGLDDWPFLNDPSNANSYVEADFDVLVRLGVDHVRIPVDFNSLADRGDGYRVDDRLIGALDQAVEWASTRGIKTVIAYHPGSALSFDDLKPGLAPIWTQVARHFEARGASEVYYEVLNEPKAPAGMSEAEATDAWGELQGEVVRAIRSADQRHPVIVGQVLDQDYLLFDKDADWREAKALPRYEDLYPDDGPFVYTFHFYSPIVFTHQGVGPRVTIQDVPFPYDSATMPRLSGLSETDQTEWDAYQRVGTAEALAKRLDEYIVQFANDRGVAVYCGEYGAFKDAPIASRLEWLRTVTALLEDRGIGRAHWSYSSGFGLFDSTSYGHRSDQLDAATVRAIGLSPLYEALLDCVNAAGADTPSVNSGTNELAVQAAASESTEAWACKLDTDKEATLDAITVSATVKSTLSWAEGSLDVRFYSADGAELDAKGAAGSRAAKQSAKMARVGDLHRYRIGSWFGQFDGLTVDETLLVPDGATEVRLYAIADSQEQTPRSGSLTLSELAVRPGVVLDPVGETFGSQSHSFEQTLFRDGQQPAWSFETVPAQAGTLKFEVKDIDGNQVATRTMAQPAAATGPISVHLDQLDLGYYTVAARFVGQDGEWGVWDSSFVVLPAQEPTPDQRFGVDAQLSFRTAPAEVSKRSAQLLAELGVGSARDRMNWSEAQPDCGTSWAEPGNGLAKAVAADLRTAGGIEDVQLFESSPECARPGSDYFKDAPTDYDAAYSYGRGYAQWALANQVRSVEVWNEPNASAFFRGYAYQYASLLKAFAAGVKSVQPGTGQDPVRVVMGGSADYPGQFMEEVYANNTAPFFDTRNQHFYRGNASNANTPADLVEFRSAEPSTMSNPWPAMSASVEKVEQEQGVADKPGWLTETGYAINRDATGSFAADELKQAEYLVKSYAQGFAAGYERVFEFAWQEVNEPVNGSFGIVRKDLSPRPATLALAVLTDHLAGAEVVATLTHGTSGRTVYFRQPSGAYVAVTWGGGANISADAAVRDVLGRPATPGEAAKTGAAPYLVSGIVQLPADAQTVKTPTGSPADTVPDAHLEVADVTVGGTAPPAPARGSTLNTEVAVAAGQEVTVSVRAWSDSRQDLSGSAAVTCQSGQGLALLSEASPKAVGEVFTCRYRATLEPGQASHATVALNGTEDVVRIALRGTPAAGSFVAAGHT